MYVNTESKTFSVFLPLNPLLPQPSVSSESLQINLEIYFIQAERVWFLKVVQTLAHETLYFASV